MTFMEAVTVTIRALAEPVIALGGGLLLTALTWHACQALRRLIQWGWGNPEE